MKKIKVFFFIILLATAAFSVYYFWIKQQDNFRRLFNQDNFSKVKSILPKDIFQSNQKNYKAFTSQNSELQLKYPADWLEVKMENAESSDIKTIFLAQDIKLDKLNQVIAAEGLSDSSFDEIIAEMEKSNKENGWEMRVVSKNSDEGIFEAEYEKAGHYILRSKEKILFSRKEEGKFYLVSFIAFSKDWQESSQRAEETITSVNLAP